MSASPSFSPRNLSVVFTLSSVVAALMTALSLAGLFFPAAFYPTADLRNSSISTDVVNLVIGLPSLLGAIALARHGRLSGLLFLPGMLLFVFSTMPSPSRLGCHLPSNSISMWFWRC
jgi:hypothetical protein